METITVNSLDGAYEQCSGLTRKIDGEGVTLLTGLSDNITSLNGNWKGSDATKHITNLSTVYNQLRALLSDAKSNVAYAASRVIAMQQVRSANGGGGSIGEELSNAELEPATLPSPDETAAYEVLPSAATDLENLKSLCTKYDSFMSQFLQDKDELLANWSAGAQRDKAVACFDELANNSETYKKYMTEARDNLEIAVSNINKLEG